jgi:ligand-binding sensor domain-containing protein
LSDGTLLAGTEDGVFRLDAPGERWIERSSGLQEFRIAALAAGRGNTVFAASWEGRVYRSNDRGERWSPLGDFSIGGPVYGLLETKDGALFMASGGSLYRWNSTDRAWSVVLTAPVKAAEPPPRIWRIMQMSGGTVIAAGNDSLFTSEDDGRTWKTAPSPDGRVNALAEDARGRLYAATTRGVWSTTVR